VVVRDTANQGRQFTQWKIADRIDSGLFTLGGNAISIDTLASVLLIASIVFAVYKSFRETEGRQNRLEQEFRNAGELQRLLIPEAQPSIPGFDLTSCYRPAQEVGGDFFQVIPLEGASAGSTLLILGDVSGKGLQAAMSVSLLVGAAQALADFVPGPAQVLGELNRRLCGRLHGGFATCVALQLDSDGTCVLSTAGHPAPYLNQHELDLPGALPLGLFETARYEQTVVQLHSGDHLALYTDGLLEARSHSGELYGFNRLQSLFATKPNAAQAAEAAIGFGQDDDITVLTLVRLAPGEERSEPRPAIALN
jgi:serine phosphatase RsbU (regulator of sigma subunit)